MAEKFAFSQILFVGRQADMDQSVRTTLVSQVTNSATVTTVITAQNAQMDKFLSAPKTRVRCAQTVSTLT